MTRLLLLTLSLLVAGCATSGGSVAPGPAPTIGKDFTRPPPQRPTTAPAMPSTSFRTPEIMRERGLETVIGKTAGQLERQFGKAQLDLIEGDARKIQFAGEPCVLDIYLYPLTPGTSPTATHVEARRASDGAAVDRASCVRALGR